MIKLRSNKACTVTDPQKPYGRGVGFLFYGAEKAYITTA